MLWRVGNRRLHTFDAFVIYPRHGGRSNRRLNERNVSEFRKSHWLLDHNQCYQFVRTTVAYRVNRSDLVRLETFRKISAGHCRRRRNLVLRRHVPTRHVTAADGNISFNSRNGLWICLRSVD